MTKRTALILGGGGQIGSAVAANLLQGGWAVQLGQRNPQPLTPSLQLQGATSVQVDRALDDSLSGAVGDGVDAVVDCMAFKAAHAEQWLALQDRVGALVVISSASVYQDDDGRTLDEAAANGFPQFWAAIREEHHTVPPGPDTYSTNKIALERTLLDNANMPATVLRPCAIHGPLTQHPREWWFIKRALDGRRQVPLAYGGSSRFHTTATANLAELCRVALDQPGSRILNIGDPEPPTVAQIGASVARSMDHDWELVGMPGPPRGTVGATPWSIPAPLIVATTAAEKLGYQPVTSHAAAMPALCADLRRRTTGRAWENVFPQLAAYPWPQFDYPSEDRVLAQI